MKALGIVAIVMAIGSIGANLYAVIETKPNYEYMDGVVNGDGPQTKFDKPLLEEYRGVLQMLAYAALGLGAVATLLGGVSGAKGFKPGFAAVGLGIAGLGWQFVWAV